MTRRDRCGACHSADLHTFLDLGSSPLADAFPLDDGTCTEPSYPLEVATCRRCSLAQLMEIVPDEYLFGADYGFFSSASPSLVAYHAAYAAELLAAYRSQAERLTVEIACNDGDLLRHFADAGCRVFGIDPALVPTEAARSRGLPVLTAPFGLDAAKRIVSVRGEAGLVVANNVLAHVADLDDWFAGLHELLAFGGVAVIQVQYLPDLLVGNQFDHIYHEHRYFFSLRPVALVAARHGLAVKHVERVPAQGGSIKMTVGHGVGYGNATASPSVDGMCAAEEWLYEAGAYDGVQDRVDYIRARLNDLLDAEKAAGRRVAGYAASAKSTTLLNWCGIGRRQLDYVVDTTPWKIGRVTPGTHIPIVSPEQEAERGERASVYLALAWNYLGGVVRREREFLDGGGRFIVPIPFPMVL